MIDNNKSGTYAVDKKTGKIVKISDKMPTAAKRGAHKCDGCCCHGD